MINVSTCTSILHDSQWYCPHRYWDNLIHVEKFTMIHSENFSLWFGGSNILIPIDSAFYYEVLCGLKYSCH
jgi:hypothetical protein